jgi:hypothetical protein
MRLDAAQLRELLAAGLIAPLAGFPGALGLTAAGRAFLRRAEAAG